MTKIALLDDPSSDHWNIDADCHHYAGARRSSAYSDEVRANIPPSYKVGAKKRRSRRAILEHDPEFFRDA